jgi:hypothetical protein
MTIASAALTELLGQSQQRSWRTKLTASHDSAQEKKGDVRWEMNPTWGIRGFVYKRIDQSGGMTAGQVCSQVANTTITNITAGTTTSITTSGLTADILVGGLLVCTDDAGAAGAAPEGEKGRIIANTATLVTIDSNDAFSAAPAVNDDFAVHLPWAVDDSADGDASGIVQGVVMAAQDQYDWGWVQFYGIHPSVDSIAAGTAIVVDESVVAGAALVTDGAADAADLRIGRCLVGLTSDTVLRETVVDLFCGNAYKMGLSAA